MLCHLCNSTIPQNRIHKANGYKTIYCSDLCNKRAWYLRHNESKNSIFSGNPQKGIKWEEWFIERFGAKRPSRSLNTPFDFFWNNEKIDLKVCELYKRKFKRGKPVNKTVGCWTFNRNSDNFDFAVCIGLINNEVTRVFKIPNKDFPKSGITVSPIKSKYGKFAIEL